jgi:hypothetical protein
MTTKRCTRCGQDQPLTQYQRDRWKSDGYRSACKACDNARYREIEGTKRGTHIQARGNADKWICESDPTRTYHGRFTKDDVAGTLADGYWPDGAVFHGDPESAGRPSRWRVAGNELHELDGTRRLTAVDYHGHPTFKEVVR